MTLMVQENFLLFVMLHPLTAGIHGKSTCRTSFRAPAPAHQAYSEIFCIHVMLPNNDFFNLTLIRFVCLVLNQVNTASQHRIGQFVPTAGG